MSVLVGYYGLISCATDVCLTLCFIHTFADISAHKFPHKFDQSFALRFTRKRFPIYKPPVSLEDRRANVSRGQRLFAFSVYNRSHIFFLQTALSRLHMR